MLRVTESKQTDRRTDGGAERCMFGFALSGLQEFLYDLSMETPSREERQAEGGRDTDAATRLRTRSAILTLIPGLVAWALKQEDRDAEIIYLGGGKLYACTSQIAVESIEPKLGDLYDWLVRCSRGALGAYWCAAETADGKCESMRRLIGALNVAKWQAGRSNGWHSAVGKIEANLPAGELGDKSWEAAEGKEFAKRNFVGFKVGAGDWKAGPWNARPVEDAPDVWLAGKGGPPGELTIAIPTRTPRFTNPVKELQGGAEKTYGPGDTVPLHLLAERCDRDEPRTLGAPYLALIKLDGDRIGALMDEALKKDDELKQYKALSDNLTRFFGERVMQILEEQFPRLYLVYSGGDDLVACGWFQDVLDAARAIRDAFHNVEPGTTVSAGITFFTRSSPILKAIEEAMEQLEDAKRAGRNRISIGGCVMTWDQFEQASAHIEALVAAIGSESINRGALQLLRQLGEAWLPDAPAPHQVRKWASIPMMHYMRSRRTGWKENEWPRALTDLFDSLQRDETDWPRAALVGTLAAWRTKKRQEEE